MKVRLFALLLLWSSILASDIQMLITQNAGAYLTFSESSKLNRNQQILPLMDYGFSITNSSDWIRNIKIHGTLRHSYKQSRSFPVPPGNECSIISKTGSYHGQFIEESNGFIHLKSQGKSIYIRLSDIQIWQTDLEIPKINKLNYFFDTKLKKARTETFEYGFHSNKPNWAAEYELFLKSETKARFNSYFRIMNMSDGHLDNAKITLIAGDMNKIKKGSHTPRYETMMLKSSATANTPTLSSLNDYYTFTPEKELNIRKNSESKHTLYPSKDIKIEKIYIIFGSNTNTDEGKASVELHIINSKNNSLGIPLPAGLVRIYSDKGLFLGEDAINNIAVDNEIHIKQGKSFDISYTRKAIDIKRQRDSEEGSIQYIIHNATDKTKKIIIRENISSNWQIKKSSHSYTKTSANQFEIFLDIPDGKSETVNYSYYKKFR